jgi:hypothetical protein
MAASGVACIAYVHDLVCCEGRVREKRGKWGVGGESWVVGGVRGLGCAGEDVVWGNMIVRQSFGVGWSPFCD